MFYYTAFGFSIASEIVFPELLTREKSAEIDVNIRAGETPKYIEDGITENPELWITPDKYLVHFKKIAWYYAENGNIITADICENAEPKSVRLFLLCNAMPAIIHQRKLIPLHASGIIVKDAVALIVGYSGAGKSTTIKALTKKGHKIFTDDVCVLKSQEKKILAIPSYPMMKLWENSFELLKLENKNEAHKLRFDIDKYGVFFHDEFVSQWKPVVKIFNIEKAEDDKIENVQIKKQSGIEAFKIIGENTYRNHYVEPMKLNTLHFEIVTGLVRQCEVYKIVRPLNRDSISEIISLIEEEL